MDLTMAVALVGLVVGLASWVVARRSARHAARLEDMYWQLRYEHSELKARVAPPSTGAPPASGSFIPLSSVKR